MEKHEEASVKKMGVVGCWVRWHSEYRRWVRLLVVLVTVKAGYLEIEKLRGRVRDQLEGLA